MVFHGFPRTSSTFMVFFWEADLHNRASQGWSAAASAVSLCHGQIVAPVWGPIPGAADSESCLIMASTIQIDESLDNDIYIYTDIYIYRYR